MDTNWPQLLQDFGPFALLPFTVLVIERIAYSRARDPKLPQTTRNRVYATAWIMIFALCFVVVTFWFLNRPKPAEAMMRGRIHGLGMQYRLRATGPEDANVRVFTYPDPQQPGQLFWRTFSTSPLEDKSELAFLLDLSTHDSEETLRFPFRVNSAYYGRATEVLFHYDPTRKRLVFENSPTGKPEELVGEPVVVAGIPRMPLRRIGPAWFASVWAQAPPSAAALLARMDSDDPLSRLSARRQFANLGPAALPEIDRVLADLNSSYRLKLGVIVAANQMAALRPEALGRVAWCEVWRSTQTGDDTLKSQAGLLLKKAPHAVDPAACLTLRQRDYHSRTLRELKVYAPAAKK